MGSGLAASFLKDPEKMSGVADTYTNLGASYDATDLGNMKKALETMSKINQIRKDVGMQELEVTDSIMAIGQIQANYAANKGNHMGLAPGYNLNTVMAVGENLAWNYLDPYLGWYDQEKAVFDKAVKALYGKEGLKGQSASDFYDANYVKIDEWVANYQASTDPYAQIGHYLAIINPVNTVYGCGYNGMNITNEQAFSGDWYASKTGEMLYSSDSYYQRFMQYYDKVYAAPDRSALTAAENDQTAKQKAADKAGGAYSAAASAQASAESAQTAAAKAYQGSIDAADEAQAKRDAAKSALDLSNGALADARAAEKAAASELEAKSLAASSAKATHEKALGELEQATARAEQAQSAYDEADAALTEMQDDMVKAAKAQLKAAQAKKDAADADLEKAKEANEAAEAQAAETATALANARAAEEQAKNAHDAAVADQEQKQEAADAAEAAYKPIRALADARNAANDKEDAAIAGKAQADAALDAADKAEQAALDAADKAKLKARAAALRAGHLAPYKEKANRDAAFENGIQDEWVFENEDALVNAVENWRGIHAKNLVKLDEANKGLEDALPELAAKQAKYADATAAYNKASLTALAAQQEYDRILEAEKAAAEEAAQAEKLANAKHAKKEPAAYGDGATLVQTGDGGLVLMMGGVAVASLGAGLIANRKRKAQLNG